jgi:hypothetical protein
LATPAETSKSIELLRECTVPVRPKAHTKPAGRTFALTLAPPALTISNPFGMPGLPAGRETVSVRRGHRLVSAGRLWRKGGSVRILVGLSMDNSRNFNRAGA